MSNAYQIGVYAGIVPDPLQTLEPVASPTGRREFYPLVFALKPFSFAP